MKLVLSACGKYYHPEGEPRTKYDRVSSVCKILSGMDDGLYSAGATDGAKAAQHLITEAYAYLQTGGQEGKLPWGMSREQAAAWVMSPDVQTMADKAHGFRHGYADRGTVLNLVFDALAAGGAMTLREAEQVTQEAFDAQRVLANEREEKRREAEELGLVKPGKIHPYACREADVIPYVHALTLWWQELDDFPFAVTHLQPHTLVCDAKLKVAGMPDAFGMLGNTQYVFEVKSGDGSMSRYYRAQLAQYCVMAGLPGLNIVVTEERVSLRVLTVKGMKRGRADFRSCLALHRRKGIGRDREASYYTDRQVRKMARESMATGAVA